MPYANKRGSFAIGALALILVLIFFNLLGMLNPLKKIFRNVFSGLSTNIRAIELNLAADFNLWNHRQDYIDAARNLETAEQLVGQLQVKLDIANTQYEKMKQLMNFKQAKTIQLFTTRVIGLESSNSEKAIIIDGGGDHNLQVGQAVVIGDGILVGKIIKVEADIAYARLLVDSQSKVAATILNNEKSIGVAEGGYGISIKMNFIPRNENISVGDLITTSGLEPQIPQGLLIGRVVAIENESYQPFQQAIISPEADLSKVDIVGVLLSN
ncbi:MAG: rod shape-determining protein MreC [bacterium]|nr:rod shape-determining protein MreC [bacterium]